MSAVVARNVGREHIVEGVSLVAETGERLDDLLKQMQNQSLAKSMRKNTAVVLVCW
jgi:hypothetical protein